MNGYALVVFLAVGACQALSSGVLGPSYPVRFEVGAGPAAVLTSVDRKQCYKVVAHELAG